MSDDKTYFLKDKETGLPNEELFIDRLKMSIAFCKRYHMSLAVCYLRIIIPPEVNKVEDSDIVKSLKNFIVDRLNQCIRDIDSVGLTKQNDLLIYFTDVSELECDQIIRRISGFLSSPYIYKQRTFDIGINIGICMYPYGANAVDQLLTIAKAEMLHALGIGENQYSFYKGDIKESAYRNAIIENDLSYAIRDRQFRVVYQPQILTSNHKVFGVESLIRWKHPKLGDIPPDEFISIAESTGKSNDVFFWLLNEVCRDIKHDPTDINIKVSLNISVNQLLSPRFLMQVHETCQKYGVEPNRFIFEITEHIRLYNLEDIKRTLISMREMGFAIALDDFGNGYFSFSDLIKLPLDFIKFDKNFVTSLIQNKRLKPVIAPIIDMSHNLGLKIIIEGVETITQFNDWKKLKCDIVQGFLLSKPVEYPLLEQSILEIHQMFEHLE